MTLNCLDFLVPHPLDDIVNYEQTLIDALRSQIRIGDRVTIVGGGEGVTAVVAAKAVGEKGSVVVCFEGNSWNVRCKTKATGGGNKNVQTPDRSNMPSWAKQLAFTASGTSFRRLRCFPTGIARNGDTLEFRLRGRGDPHFAKYDDLGRAWIASSRPWRHHGAPTIMVKGLESTPGLYRRIYRGHSGAEGVRGMRSQRHSFSGREA